MKTVHYDPELLQNVQHALHDPVKYTRLHGIHLVNLSSSEYLSVKAYK